MDSHTQGLECGNERSGSDIGSVVGVLSWLSRPLGNASERNHHLSTFDLAPAPACRYSGLKLGIGGTHEELRRMGKVDMAP